MIQRQDIVLILWTFLCRDATVLIFISLRLFAFAMLFSMQQVQCTRPHGAFSLTQSGNKWHLSWLRRSSTATKAILFIVLTKLLQWPFWQSHSENLNVSDVSLGHNPQRRKRVEEFHMPSIHEGPICVILFCFKSCCPHSTTQNRSERSTS